MGSNEEKYRVLGAGVKMVKGRLLKMVMIEALELESKVKWERDLWQSLEVLGGRS